MLRFTKPARGKDIHQRGYFSYITEGIIHIYNAKLSFPNEEFKVYFDLFDIQGYGKGNIYDVCFNQDTEDYKSNLSLYSNIEELTSMTRFDPYDETTFTKEKFESCELIIKNHLTLNDEMKSLMSSRHSQIDFTKTIGFHRRATDMKSVHHISPISLENIFNTLEEEDFENVFLMSDNMDDLNKFKQRYGNRLITFDEFSTSELDSNPFFKMNKDEESTKNHIKEIVFGAYTLGMTKKLYCTKSNLSTFSILSNSNLNYKRLN
jgi:hypothetical protein